MFFCGGAHLFSFLYRNTVIKLPRKKRFERVACSVGLFNRKKGKDKKNDLGDLSEYAGLRLEIMDGQENLLFIAYAHVAWDGVISLRPAAALRIPPGLTSIYVQMRGYQSVTKKAIHMTGVISPDSDGSWKIDNLKLTGKDNDRAFYRQDIGIAGSIMPMRQRSGVDALPCRIVNVSVGGTCLQLTAEFMIGEKLLLRTSLFPGWKPTTLMCVVRRITRRRNFFEYGCEFLDLTPAVEEAISKSILEMQLERLRNNGA